MTNDDDDDFDLLCARIRRNNPSCRHVLFSIATPRGYGQRLGAALLGKSHVMMLQLSMDRLFMDDVAGEELDRLALPLLQFLRESITLQNVYLGAIGTCPRIAVPLAGMILHAVASNSNIRLFEIPLRSVKCPPESLAYLIRTTKSIETFALDVEFTYDGSRFNEILPSAFGDNASLKRLTIEYGDNVVVAQRIVHAMRSHPVLDRLTLEYKGFRVGRINRRNGASGTASSTHNVVLFQAVGQLLYDTKTLYDFFLYRVDVGTDGLHCLFDGIGSNKTLRKITLDDCAFNIEATTTFISLMTSTKYSSTLETLCFRGRNMFAGLSNGYVAAAVLIIPEGHKPKSTVGSSLRKVDLEKHHVFSFCKTLVENESRTRLPALELRDLDAVACDALCQCLPKQSYLWELKINQVDEDVHLSTLIDAIEHNGSLIYAFIFRHSYVSALCQTLESRKLNCAMRNFWVPELLQNPSGRKNTVGSYVKATELWYYPTLFDSMKRAPRVSPNTILMGLLMLSDFVGPFSCS